jgi:hypothetical protein
MGNDHIEWKSNLGFCQDELKIFKERLDEVAGKNTGKEIMQMVEHFQNQFLIHSEAIDVLLHDINENLALAASEAEQRAGHISKDKISVHDSIRERVENEMQIFKDLKGTFTAFLSKVM